MITSISTTEILAIRILDRVQKMYGFNMQECYRKWACTQLKDGVSVDHINMLAAVSTQDNFFLVESYFMNALKELKITLPMNDDAIKQYAKSIFAKMLGGELNEKEGSHILSKLCADLKYPSQYMMWHELNENIMGKSDAELKQAIKEQALLGMKHE